MSTEENPSGNGHSTLPITRTIETGINPVTGKPSILTVRTAGKKLGNPDGTDIADTAGISERTLTDPIVKRIRDLESKLDEESNQLDPVTRRPAKKLTDKDQRNRLARELLHLTQSELPYARLKWKEIEARNADAPTVRDQLQGELDRKARIQARAVAIAEEMEAQEAALKVPAQRRSSGQGGNPIR
ncbi:hypothetical protein [Lysobacter sp. A421]